MKTVYIYNKVKESMKTVLFLAVGSVFLTGCSDFLEIKPMDKTVLEDYWKEKADVTATVNGAYEALASSDVINRLGVWGELRSDNVIAGTSTPNNINELLNENVLQTNQICEWSSVYRVINRCNIVCHYAPDVEQIDPNYTYNEMKATIAEMKALRALCYFYLIRTFRDVPYTTEPSIDDDQNYVIPASKFEDILDNLISDLEEIKEDAQLRFDLEKVRNKAIDVPIKNNSRITRNAIYALLADLYLWKGDWDNVIKYCDKVIDYKKQQFDELSKKDQINDVALFDGIPMIMEAAKGSKDCGKAYTSIFGQGNSFESIFEIYYGNTGLSNGWVSSYYGRGGTPIGYLKPAEFLMRGFTKNENQVWLSNEDCRAHEDIRAEGSSYAITKYVYQSTDFNMQSPSSVTLNDNRRSSGTANWIIYRLSDILLMKAEALIQRGEADYQEAFNLINIVYKRANNVSPEAAGLSYDTYKDKMEDLLFEERHREFIFEGKRWYDLVRISRRKGNTDYLTSCVVRKYTHDINVIKIKLADPNYIYFPYAKSELKVNPLLEQNPAFNKGEEGLLK